MSDLDWPEEFERTPIEDRESYPGGFRVTQSQAFQNVLDELRGWEGVTDVQFSTDAQHIKSGVRPYRNASPDDPGVVVRFTKDGEEMAAACDRWNNLRDNAQDLYHYLHETRMQEQRGTVTAESEYQKLRLPSGDEDAVVGRQPPHEVLGVAPDAPEAVVKGAARSLKAEHHPDRGGDETQFKRVVSAEEAMLE